MNIIRQQKIPLIYTELSFIRKSPPCILTDSEADMNMLKELQSIARGELCLSANENSHELRILDVFPDNIIDLEGCSGEIIEWHYYFWKIYDVESLYTDRLPGEAVEISSLPIVINQIEELGITKSCIPLLKNTEKRFNYSDYDQGKRYELGSDLLSKIKVREDRLFAIQKASTLKTQRNRTTQRKPLSPSQKRSILERDNFKCIFCGKSSQNTTLEVDHAIPLSLIKRLDLDKSLEYADFNLSTTCSECNKGKSDFLSRQTISYYMDMFKMDSHPNHDLIEYLNVIKDIQNIANDV
jgi:5-methylcytosine-specific restriction endonuclease McrA